MPCACSDFRIICLFSVFSTEVLLLAHLQTSVSKVRFRRLVRKFYYLRTCRLPYLRPVFKVWDGSFSHCIPTNLRRERVNRIALIDTSNFNDSRAFVQISSNFCSISSNLILTGDVSFRSVGEKRNELPEFFPKAHVMEQVKGISLPQATARQGSFVYHPLCFYTSGCGGTHFIASARSSSVGI